MNWVDYLNLVPKTLDERRTEKSVQYKKEKRNEYRRKSRAKKKAQVVDQSNGGKQ